MTEKQQIYQHYHLKKLILPSDQGRVIEQAKFTYSPLVKALEKQRKAIENQGKQLAESNALVKKVIMML